MFVRLYRPATLAAAAVILLALGACKSSDTATPAPSGGGPTATTGSAPAAGTGANTVTGEPVGDAGDPCLLLTPADVQAAFGQTVSAVRRLKATTDEDGVSQQCVLVTSGPAMNGPGMAALSTMAKALGGQKVDAQPASAAIGVTLVKRPTVMDMNDPGDGDPLPPNAKKLPDVGQGGVIISPPAGAVGVALIDPHRGVYIMDLEGRAVPLAEMEKLLRAAVAHAG